MASSSERLAIKERAEQRLLALPGVNGVGLGCKEVAGASTPAPSIKIMVSVKRPLHAIPPAERIPAEIEGVPTDVIEGGEIQPFVNPPPGAIGDPFGLEVDNSRCRPLEGGSVLTAADSSESGTLGCILEDTSDPSKLYALTNYHVVDPRDLPSPVPQATKVGQPTGTGSITACFSDLIGLFAGGALVPHERDEALVQLAPGMQWRGEVLEVGALTGVHELSEADENSQSYKVEKRGAGTKLTGGVVRIWQFATAAEKGNLIVIKPNPNPNAAGATVRFGFHGDSGAVVVNEQRQAVGLFWGGDAQGNGFAYQFSKVLSRFAANEHINVALAVRPAHAVQTVPGAAMVATPPELREALGDAGRPAPARQPVPQAPPPGWAPRPQPLTAASPALERDLDRSPAGRLLITVWLEHQMELLTLLNRNRRVAVAWHRSGAAAVFQALARMPSDPALALPETIHGEPLSSCLDRMQGVFERVASSRLSDDLARLRGMLPELAGLTYPQILDALGTG